MPDLSWFLLVSGQDYPCRSMRSIEAELAASPYDAYLRWMRADGDPRDDVHPWQARTRDRYLHRLRVPFTSRHVPFPRRPPFRDGTGLYVGDMWPNLGARAVEHLLAQGALRSRVEPYLSRCTCPDEALLPTLLLNGPPGRDAPDLKVANDRKRYIRWVEGEAHPHLLEPHDVPLLTASGDFFARKVDSERTPAVLDLLDAQARREGGAAAPVG